MLLNTIASPFKEYGAIGGLLYALDRILKRLSPKLGIVFYELMAQPIHSKPLLTVGLKKNLKFVEITPDHPGTMLMPARPEIRAARFAQGAICLGVYRKGDLLGYAWFCFGAYEEDEVRCTYVLAEPESSVFDFDLYVFPEHRMGIGFAAIWHGANEFLHARAIRTTFSRISRTNLASRRAHAHLGSVCLGRALFFKAWKFELMLSNLSPYISVSSGDAARPTLRLKARSPAQATA